MKKQVRESKAGQSISAYVILNKAGQHVATVHQHCSNYRVVTVDVWQHDADVLARCAVTADFPGCKPPALYGAHKADIYDRFQLQQGRAAGYGYDKATAALAGIIIDGHTLADHCGRAPEVEKRRVALLKRYQKHPDAMPYSDWHKAADRIGCRWANGMQSLHVIGGLERLESLGYTVIQAI